MVAARSEAFLALSLQGRCLRHPMPGTWQCYSLAGAEQAAAGPHHRHDPRTAHGRRERETEGTQTCTNTGQRAQSAHSLSTVHCRYLAKFAIVLALGVALNLSGDALGLADLLLRQFGIIELGRVHLMRRARAGLNACRATKKQAPTACGVPCG